MGNWLGITQVPTVRLWLDRLGGSVLIGAGQCWPGAGPRKRDLYPCPR